MTNFLLLVLGIIIVALTVVDIGLQGVLAVIRFRKRRLEKPLERLEQEDRERRSSDALR
jgi:hypothetical protein